MSSYELLELSLHPKQSPSSSTSSKDTEGSQYLLQGDNNAWQDSYQPAPSEIAGKLWFNVPYAGEIIRGFRSPVGAAILAGIIGYFLFWPDSKQEDER